MNQPQSEFLTGIIERITFHSEESGYTVARLQIPKATDLITIIGDFANIQAGQTLKLPAIPNSNSINRDRKIFPDREL
jgi:exodeoxyribonuclease V alpha subunit